MSLPTTQSASLFTRHAARWSLVCVVTALTACGGGEESPLASSDPEGSTPISQDSDRMALTAVLHDYCEVGAPLQTPASGTSGLSYEPLDFWTHNRTQERTGSVYAWGVSEFSTLGPLKLLTDYADITNAVGQGQVIHGSGEIGMGVGMIDVLPDQAVGCVRSVAHAAFSETATPNGWETRISRVEWYGREMRALPMATLPSPPKNGFEFAANFSLPAQQSVVFFNVLRSEWLNPAAARICLLKTGSEQWDCKVPAVFDGGGFWSLQVDGIQPGVYVLI